MATYHLTLSTTEPNNYVGLLKLRQGDINSQTLQATITANGQLFKFDGLSVYLNAVLPNGLVVRDKVTQVDVLQSTLTYPVIDSFLQEVARVTAWFSFESDGKIIESTKNFHYSVMPGWKDKIKQGNYIYELSEIQREIEKIIGNKDFSSLIKRMDALETKNNYLEQVKANKDDLDQTNVQVALNASNISTNTSKINSLASGAPIAVSLVSKMTDKTKNYVYTGSEAGYTTGNWYFWTGSAWASGGVYQASALIYGKYAFLSDALDFNTSTRVLSWPATYLFNVTLSRTALAAGSIDLTSLGATAQIYYDTNAKTISATGTTATLASYHIPLGVLWMQSGIEMATNSTTNFNLTIDGVSSKNINPSYFTGKKVNWLGDSITAFQQFQSTVNSIIQFSEMNTYGVGGTSLSAAGSDDTSSFSYRSQKIDETADLTVVFGGTNDWGNIPEKPLGVMGDTSNTTVYGVVDSIINTILTNAPTQRIAFITPLQRNFKTSPSTVVNGWSETTENGLGYKLGDVVAAIKEVCGRYGVPVLDLYHSSGITNANLAVTTRDGLHPNMSVGMPLIGRQIAAFIHQL